MRGHFATVFLFFVLSLIQSPNAQANEPLLSQELSVSVIQAIIAQETSECSTNPFNSKNIKAGPSLIQWGDKALANDRKVITVESKKYIYFYKKQLFNLFRYSDKPNFKPEEAPILATIEAPDCDNIYLHVFKYDRFRKEEVIEAIVFHNNFDQIIRRYRDDEEKKPLSQIYARSEMVDLHRRQLDKKTLVAVIDSGVYYNHPGLAYAIERRETRQKEWENLLQAVITQTEELKVSQGCLLRSDCAKKYKFLSEQQSYIIRRMTEESAIPLDYWDQDDNPNDFVISNSGQRVDDHGTHVAGIIAQTKDVRILPFRGWDTEILGNQIKLMNYYGVRVVNMSYCCFQQENDFEAAQKNDQILFVVSAGNDGTNIDKSEKPTYPRHLNYANFITVANVLDNNQLSSDSNYGPNTVEIAARGTQIRSTIPNGKYAEYSGTSMAAPQITRAAARMLNENPNLTSQQLIQILMATGDRVHALKDKVKCGCVLNEDRAIAAAKATKK
jgi:subtilisin family serine protease